MHPLVLCQLPTPFGDVRRFRRPIDKIAKRFVFVGIDFVNLGEYLGFFTIVAQSLLRECEKFVCSFAIEDIQDVMTMCNSKYIILTDRYIDGIFVTLKFDHRPNEIIVE